MPRASRRLLNSREPAEIIGGKGEDVLNGTAKIVTASGEDVTELYMEGAAKTLAYAKEINASAVILKENSPSCGSSFIYNGTFSGKNRRRWSDCRTAKTSGLPRHFRKPARRHIVRRPPHDSRHFFILL